jgi:hypothetical protein
VELEGFVPANPLEEALRDAALDPSRMRAFRALLAEQLVLVPVASPPVGDRVEFPLVEFDGVTHISVFTSEAQLALGGRPGHDQLRLSGRDLARMWPRGVALAINPGGALGFSMPAEEVEALTAPPGGGAGQRRIPAGAELIVGDPAQEPRALLDRLGAVAATLPEVVALHRALIQVKGSSDGPQLIIGVEFASTSDPRLSLSELAEAAGRDAALLALSPAADDPISAWMRGRDAPFYRSVASD